MKVEVELTSESKDTIVAAAIVDALPYVDDPKDAAALIRTYKYFVPRVYWAALWDVVSIPTCLEEEYEELKDLLGKD